MTLRDVIARLDHLADDETIYAESATPTARAGLPGIEKVRYHRFESCPAGTRRAA
jgi:hypothetical protein